MTEKSGKQNIQIQSHKSQSAAFRLAASVLVKQSAKIQLSEDSVDAPN